MMKIDREYYSSRRVYIVWKAETRTFNTPMG